MDPAVARRVAAPVVSQKAPRRERQVKRYVHPENGEIIETKGGNHAGLKAWKAQYGSDIVESWLSK